MLAAVARKDYEDRRRREAQGIVKAKAAGAYRGRPEDTARNPGIAGMHTAWDIGVDDAMAIWCFQVYPDHLDIVDYYEGHGQGFDHYCEWLNKRGYHGTDWYPTT
jgi:hypothetical protein